MKIMCAHCGNEVGQYTPKAKGKPIDNGEIRKNNFNIVCKNNTSTFGPEITLPDIDPLIYSVRIRKEKKCGKRLQSFTVKGGVIWGM